MSFESNYSSLNSDMTATSRKTSHIVERRFQIHRDLWSYRSRFVENFWLHVLFRDLISLLQLQELASNLFRCSPRTVTSSKVAARFKDCPFKEFPLNLFVQVGSYRVPLFVRRKRSCACPSGRKSPPRHHESPKVRIFARYL